MEEVSSLDLYIPSLSQVSSLYTAAPMISTPSSSTVTVNVGFSLSLSCTSRNSPPDTFTWRKDNGPVLQSTTNLVTYTSTSAVFRADYIIDEVTASDSGTYTCTVTNAIGSDSATITVVIISKLSIYVHMSFMTLDLLHNENMCHYFDIHHFFWCLFCSFCCTTYYIHI